MEVSDFSPACLDYTSNDSKSSKSNSERNLTVQTSKTALHEKVLIVTPSNEVVNIK